MIGFCKPLSQTIKDSLLKIFMDYNRILYFKVDNKSFCVPFNDDKNRIHAFDLLKEKIKKTIPHYVSCNWWEINYIIRNKGGIE